MKILKRVLFILLLFVVLGLLAALLLPKDIHVERTRTINAPAASVFNQINTLKNWEKWSPWMEQDPAMELSYTGASAGKGAAYSWTGPKMGSGKMTVTESVPFKLVKTNLEFDQGGGVATFNLVDKGSSTEVTWMMDSHMAWPSNLFGLGMDRMLGPVFDRGMENIETQLTQ